MSEGDIFACVLCGKFFNSLQELKAHDAICPMKWIGPTPIYCQYCGYKTHSPADLAEHEASCPKNPANLIPIGPTWIYCRYCGYRTASPYDLLLHERSCPQNPANITPVTPITPTPVTPTPVIPPSIVVRPAPQPYPVTEVAPLVIDIQMLTAALLIVGAIGLTLFFLRK